MPEPPAWHYQKITQPMFDNQVMNVALTNARILTCVGDEIIENGFVQIEDGEIVAVGAMDQLGDDVAQLDCAGTTIIPGMMNSHAHLAWDGVHDLARQSMDDAPEISAYKAAGNMLKSLRAGITLVRDLGMNKSNFFAKQAVAQGIFPGPRLLICGEAIIQTGGHTYWCCREASGADEMRRAVREQVRGGADLIKIMASHDLIEFTDAELEAVIDETHRNGLPITAHATFNDVIKRVVQFGVDCVEHGGSMDDETIQLLLDTDTPIVTTFAPLVQQSNAEIARKYNIPEWKIEERQKAIAAGTRFEGLQAAAKAGVTIAFGTDAGSPAVGHEVVAPELKFMVKLGVKKDNYDALHCATIVPAKIHKLDDQLGTLEAGKAADLVVLRDNPLDDLDGLETVQMTFVGGKMLYALGA
ncbi:MAG: amidohydrolase family protein [Chloroflexota bacterium]